MKVINEMKSVNGSILLADGMSIGALSGGVSFQDLQGAIGYVNEDRFALIFKSSNLYFFQSIDERIKQLQSQLFC